MNNEETMGAILKGYRMAAPGRLSFGGSGKNERAEGQREEKGREERGSEEREGGSDASGILQDPRDN